MTSKAAQVTWSVGEPPRDPWGYPRAVRTTHRAMLIAGRPVGGGMLRSGNPDQVGGHGDLGPHKEEGA